MYNYENIGTPQGWQCPVCKRVYSPMTYMCFYCCGHGQTIASTETNSKKVDWTLPTTITTDVDIELHLGDDEKTGVDK